MLDFLKSQVGRPYRDFDDEGNYLGCFEPLYLLWPKLPRDKLPEDSVESASLRNGGHVEFQNAENSRLRHFSTSEKGSYFAPVEPASQSLTSPPSSPSNQAPACSSGHPRSYFPPVQSQIASLRNGGHVEFQNAENSRLRHFSHPRKYFAFAYFRFLQNFAPVDTPNPLDVVAFRFPGDIFHVGICLTDGTFLHVQRGNYYEIRRFTYFQKYVLGYFRPREEARN